MKAGYRERRAAKHDAARLGKRATTVINYPTLAHLTNEQRKYIGRVISAVERTNPDAFRTTLCFKVSQSIARWDYEHGQRRIT